jgi:hypothetical protein
MRKNDLGGGSFGWGFYAGKRLFCYTFSTKSQPWSYEVNATLGVMSPFCAERRQTNPWKKGQPITCNYFQQKGSQWKPDGHVAWL